MSKVLLLTSTAAHPSNVLQQPKCAAQVCYEFAAEIAATGLQAPPTIEPDGLIHRFDSGGKRKGKAGWYVLHLDGIAAGSFGSWDKGWVMNWVSLSYTQLDAQQRNLVAQRIKQALIQRQALQAQHHHSVQMSAISRWRRAKPAITHPYLTTKSITGYGLRMDGSSLLVPVRDAHGILHSLQTINTKGEKLFLKGGRVRGCYYSIGQPYEVIVVAEGMATAHSIHDATGLPVAAAFSAGNLLPVAQSLKAKLPQKTIFVAADDDHTTHSNPGLIAAREAAMAVGGYVVSPQFTAGRPRKATDFNDLAQLEGKPAVAACFTEVLEGLHYE